MLSWKHTLGSPGRMTHLPRPDRGTSDYGGGPSFDRLYTTPQLDWTFESRNVGRSDGHMARVIVTRNETGLPWKDGWSAGDETLEELITAAMVEIDAPKFSLGQLVATPGALSALAANAQQALDLICRHVHGDWGEVDAQDKRANDRSLKDKNRLLSAYRLKDGTRVWIITEADRSATTILLPEEY